jgi:type II secretory pathway component PulC
VATRKETEVMIFLSFKKGNKQGDGVLLLKVLISIFWSMMSFVTRVDISSTPIH